MIGAAGEIRIVDTDRNGHVTQDEFEAQAGALTPGDSDTIVVDGTTISVNGSMWNELKDRIKNGLLAANAVNEPPTENQLDNMRFRVADFTSQAKALQEEINSLKASGIPETVARLVAAQNKLNDIKELLQTAIRNLEFLNQAAGKAAANKIDASAYEMIGETPPGREGGDSKASFAMTSSGSSGGGAGAGTGAKATTVGGGAPTVFPPTGYGTDPFGGAKGFTTDAFMKSSMMEDNILSSFDSVLQSQSKGKQLMMLFFYFARMAESGDLGAMYQFMKFLTFIISKDKAKQQIDMGKKLVELQDLSRQWTDKLLNTSTNASDPNSSNDFMKVMTQVKSETDAIATSQKLISQMMEEFAQVVETLTNVTKSALEAQGRVMRAVSVMR